MKKNNYSEVEIECPPWYHAYIEKKCGKIKLSGVVNGENIIVRGAEINCNGVITKIYAEERTKGELSIVRIKIPEIDKGLWVAKREVDYANTVYWYAVEGILLFTGATVYTKE